MTPRRIDRDQLEAKLAEIKGEVDSASGQAKPALLAVGVAVGVAVAVGIYLLGQRKGRKRTTVVEIRRV